MSLNSYFSIYYINVCGGRQSVVPMGPMWVGLVLGVLLMISVLQYARKTKKEKPHGFALANVSTIGVAYVTYFFRRPLVS